MRIPIRLAIFASGNGTNAISIIQNVSQSYDQELKVEFVLSDQKSAAVIEKSQKLKIPTYIIEKTSTKQEHENEILQILKKHQIDWICLAGYMRILSENFLTHFNAWHENQCQVVNIHPSLLPLYPGLESIERAFADKVSESGVTLHLVDRGVDTGSIIYQSKVILRPDEEFKDFKRHIHEAEYSTYKSFLQDLALERHKTIFFKDV